MRTLSVMFAVLLAMVAGNASEVFAQETPVEVSLYGGAYWGEKNDWFYLGADGTAFVLDFHPDGGMLRLGPSLGFTAWDGEIHSGVDAGVDYDGYKAVAGGEAQYLTATSKTSLKLRYGVKKGGAQIDQVDLVADEECNLLNAELFHQRWWNRPLLGRVLVGIRGDFDLGGNKTTQVNGNSIAGDERLDQTEYGPWAQLDLIQGGWGYTFAGLSATHRNYDDKTAVEAMLGVRLFREVLEVKGGKIFLEDNDAWGVGVIINLHHLSRYF